MEGNGKGIASASALYVANKGMDMCTRFLAKSRELSAAMKGVR